MKAEADTPDPIPAATLVVFRKGRAAPEPEILMTIRSRTMSFAGGMAVFPGGSSGKQPTTSIPCGVAITILAL